DQGRPARPDQGNDRGCAKRVADDCPRGLMVRTMSIFIPEKDLPVQLSPEEAVEAAYASELAEVASKLQRGLPTLIECDKDLAPYLYLNLRNRLRTVNLRCLYLDGRPRQEEQQGAMPMGMIGTMIAQLREAV